MSTRLAAGGWQRHREHGLRFEVADEFADAVRALGLPDAGRLDALLRAHGHATLGRGPVARVTLPATRATTVPRRLHLRPLRRAGLFGRLLGWRVFSPGRACSELRTTARLHTRGAAVPTPVFAMAVRHGLAWRCTLATEVVEGADDAVAWLTAGPPRCRIAAAAQALGRALRHFHDAGGRHADLHLGNLLVRELTDTTVEVWIVDLDRGSCGPPPSPARRMRELMRLYRSLLKRGLDVRVDSELRAGLLRAYVGGDRTLARALCERLPRERRRLLPHRLAYVLRARRAALR